MSDLTALLLTTAVSTTGDVESAAVQLVFGNFAFSSVADDENDDVDTAALFGDSDFSLPRRPVIGKAEI
jgi:hypothetical protein